MSKYTFYLPPQEQTYGLRSNINTIDLTDIHPLVVFRPFVKLQI